MFQATSLLAVGATLTFIASLVAATATVQEQTHVERGALNCSTSGIVEKFTWVVGQCKDDEMVTELDTNTTPRRCYYSNEYNFGDTSCGTPSGELFHVCDVCVEYERGNYSQYSNCHAGSTAVTVRTECDSKCSNCKSEVSMPIGCEQMPSVKTSRFHGFTDCSRGLVKWKKFTSATCDEVIWEKAIPLQMCSGIRGLMTKWVV